MTILKTIVSSLLLVALLYGLLIMSDQGGQFRRSCSQRDGVALDIKGHGMVCIKKNSIIEIN